MRHGCDGFELDVRRSADGQAMICHDPKSASKLVAETPARMLNLPTLEDVLERFSSRAFLDIEIKAAGLEDRTAAALRVNPPLRGYVISSFLPEVLLTMHDRDAGVPLGFICEDHALLERWREMPVEWVIPRWDLTTKSLITELKNAGRKVMPWTVNNAKQMRRLAEMGVDGIISDHTDLLTHTLSVGSPGERAK